MSTKMMLEITRHSTTRGNAKLILLVIASYTHPDGTHCEASLSTLAKEAGLSRRQVTTIVHTLAAEGHITLLSGATHRRSNRYAVLRPWLAHGRSFHEVDLPLGQPLPYRSEFPRATTSLGQPLPRNIEPKERKRHSRATTSLGQPLPHQTVSSSEDQQDTRTNTRIDPQGSAYAAMLARSQVVSPNFARTLRGAPAPGETTITESTPAAPRPPRKPRGEGLYKLGTLCKRGHDHEGTGKSLRRLPSGSCLQCDLARQEAKRQAQVRANRAARGPRRIVNLDEYRTS